MSHGDFNNHNDTQNKNPATMQHESWGSFLVKGGNTRDDVSKLTKKIYKGVVNGKGSVKGLRTHYKIY